jgi:hypothetical protein
MSHEKVPALDAKHPGRSASARDDHAAREIQSATPPVNGYIAMSTLRPR